MKGKVSPRLRERLNAEREQELENRRSPTIPESRQTDDRLDEETERLIRWLSIASSDIGTREAEIALRERIRELVEEARKEGTEKGFIYFGQGKPNV